MQHVLVYGNEKFEAGIMLASISAGASAMDFTGYLARIARVDVLRQVAALKVAQEFEWFELHYPAYGDKCARAERWVLESECESSSTPRFTVPLADGRTLCQSWAVATPKVLQLTL